MRLGGQRVGIVRDVPVLDGQGAPVFGVLGQPATTEVVAWVDDCLFETQLTAEADGEVTTATVQRAWCFMPVVDGHVPAVDNAGQPAPIAVTDITAEARLRYGNDFQMIGDAVLEMDLNGREDHTFCLCQRQFSSTGKA